MKYYCDVLGKTLDGDFHKECYWELGKVEEPEKACFNCERYRRIQNEKKIRVTIPAIKDLSSKENHKKKTTETNLKGKEKSKGSYESFEEMRRKASLVAEVMIWEAYLKFYKNPVGMLKDINHSWFAEPFRDYCLDLISFKEAQRQLNQIQASAMSQLTISSHEDVLRIVHMKKTGRDFSSDLAAVKDPDNKVSREAAINLVKSFKSSFLKKPIRDVISKALIEGDENFGDAIMKAFSDPGPDAKRNRRFISFMIFNEGFLKDPELSEEEVLSLARKQGVLSDMDESETDTNKEENLLKYLRRHGIRMKSKTQIRREKFTVPVQAAVEKKLESKKDKFVTYLFGNFTPDQIRQKVEKIKESLFS